MAMGGGKRIRYGIIIGVVILVAGALGARVLVGPGVPVVLAERRPLVQKIVANGRVNVPVRVQLGTQAGGVLARLAVDQGDSVVAGQLLAELVSEEAAAGVARAAARLQQVRELDLRAAQEDLRQAEVALRQAERQLQRMSELAVDGGISEQELEVAQDERDLALSRRDGAAANVRGNSAGGANERLAVAELAAAQARLEQTRITSPVDGVVLKRLAQPGDMIAAGSGVLDVAPAGPTWLVVQPEEKNLAFLRVGQQALASADAWPGQCLCRPHHARGAVGGPGARHGRGGAGGGPAAGVPAPGHDRVDCGGGGAQRVGADAARRSGARRRRHAVGAGRARGARRAPGHRPGPARRGHGRDRVRPAGRRCGGAGRGGAHQGGRARARSDRGPVMPFEWFVALRYLREGRIQTVLILLGVSTGVGVIIFLSALITGLQASLIENTLGSQAHMVVRPTEEMPRLLHEGRVEGTDPAALARDLAPGEDGLAVRLEKPAQRLRSINQWPQVVRDIEQVAGVTAVSPLVAGSAFVTRGEATRSVALRGIDPERFTRIIDLPANMVAGSFRVQGTEAVIGTGLSSDLGVRTGDRIRVLTADGRTDVFTISGIFDLQNKGVNDSWVLVSLKSAQNLLDLSGGISAIEARVDRIFDAERIAQQVARRTGLIAESWMELNGQLLVGLRSQSSSSTMIQAFVVVAVALGIASVLVVWVVQKNREIGILRAVGTTRRQILRVFLIQGLLLGAAGWVVGVGIGTVLSLIFASLARNPDGSPTFPVNLSWQLFLGTLVMALSVGLLSATAPARRAAALDPAEAIHHG
jgi:lipoprotein-releasing system permease protein